MYEQKTIIKSTIEELDAAINKLYDQDYLYTGPAVCIKNGSGFMQTVVKMKSNRRR